MRRAAVFLFSMTSPIDDIKSRIDIVEFIQSYLKLVKTGSNWRGLCPFHKEKTPSFFVSQDKQIFHCFGCSLGGDIFKFVMQMEGLEFSDALKLLAQKTGVQLHSFDRKLSTQRSRLISICDAATSFFQYQLEHSISGRKAKEYLKQRRLRDETISEFRLGYAPKSSTALYQYLTNKGFKLQEIKAAGLVIEGERGVYDRFRGRIMFPFFSLQGEAVGFTGRALKEDMDNINLPAGKIIPKYINSPQTAIYDKGRILYGLDKSKIDIRKKDECVLVEGNMDLLLAWQDNVNNVVATSGTALTEAHLTIVGRYTKNLLYSFDMDEAGEGATKRAIMMALAKGFNIKVATMPEGKDPADFVKENPGKLQGVLEQTKSIMEFYFERTFLKIKDLTIEAKKQSAEILLPLIKKISNKIEQAFWLQALSKKIETNEQVLLAQMQSIKVLDPADKIDLSLETAVGSQIERSEIFEQNLLELILLHSDAVKDNIESFDDIFEKDLHKKIFADFKKSLKSETFDLLIFKKNLGYFATKVDEMSFRLSLTKELSFSPAEEIAKAASQIRRFRTKDRIEEITKKMREAEINNNKKEVARLKEEIQTAAFSLSKM